MRLPGKGAGRKRKMSPFSAALMGSPTGLGLVWSPPRASSIVRPFVLLTILWGRAHHPPSYRRHLMLREIK